MEVAGVSSTCRLAGEVLPIDLFRSIACTQCLLYIYFVAPPHTHLYQVGTCPNGLLICPRPADPHSCRCDNPHNVYNIPEFALNSSGMTPLWELSVSPPLPPAFDRLTQQCCQAASDCCQHTLKHDPGDTVCPATWDGWQCFEAQSEPTFVQKTCPSYIYGDQPRYISEPNVRKECTVDGWGHAPEGNRDAEWTDYSKCQEQEAQVKLIAGLLAFSVSVLVVVPAVLALTMIRPLNSEPVFIIHRHLLVSFLLSAVSYLFNSVFFVVDGAPGDILYFTNHIACRIAFVIQLRFLRLSTFSWMLAEGVYLYRLLRGSRTEESLLPYKILCWGVPLLLSIVYSALRQTFDNEACWVSPSHHTHIESLVIAPCLIAICANVLLVCVIMCILVKKLRYNPHLEPMQYKKAVRAALMLIPVFGLHFLFTIYRLPSQSHQIINLVLDGLQGSFAAIILVYTNRSVIEGVRRGYKALREKHDLRRECAARSSSTTNNKLPLVAGER